MTEKTKEKKQPLFYTTYEVAVNWLHNNFILCNNITDIDESVWDNMRFSYYDDENDSFTEIYQWFITDCSEDDVKLLENYFNLLFTYSDKLDCYILCVDHLGTSWGYVSCPVYGTESSHPLCKTYEELTGYKY